MQPRNHEAADIASLRASHSQADLFRRLVSDNLLPHSRSLPHHLSRLGAHTPSGTLSTSASHLSLAASDRSSPRPGVSADVSRSSVEDPVKIRVHLNDFISKRGNSPRRLAGSDAANEKIRLLVKGEIDRYVIRPDDRLKRYWDMYVFLLLVYVATVSVFVFSFLGILGLSSPWFWVERFIDLSFVADIMLNFFTAYEKFGVLVTDRHAIRRRYLTTWFIPDVLATFPWDLIAISIQQTDGPHVLQLPRYIRLVRLFKLFRLTRVLRLTQNFTWLEIKLRLKYGYTRIAGLITTTLLIAHWFACLFFYFGSVGMNPQTWITQDGIPADLYGRYISALYFSVYTITTIGYGDVVPENTLERSYTTIIMLLGAACFAYIISQVSNIVGELNASSAQQRVQMDTLTDLAQYRQLPEPLVFDIRRFFQREFLRQRVADEKALLYFMSKDLRIKVLKHIYGTHLETSRLFKDVPADHLDDVYDQLSEKVVRKDERLYVQGDYPEYFYIIVAGEVELTAPGLPPVTLGEGDIVGEHDIIFNRQRHETATCRTFSDLVAVPRTAVMKCLEWHKGALKKLRDEEAIWLWERALGVVEQQMRFASMARRLRLRAEGVAHHEGTDVASPGGRRRSGIRNSPSRLGRSVVSAQALSGSFEGDMGGETDDGSDGCGGSGRSSMSLEGMQLQLEVKDREIEVLEGKLTSLQRQLRAIAEGLRGRGGLLEEGLM